MLIFMVLVVLIICMYLNWDVTKDSTAKFRVDYPLGSEPPPLIDDHARNTRKGFQERLNIDHVFEDDETDNMDGVDTGKHKQVTFADPITTPEPLPSEGVLYTKDVKTGETDYAELHFCDEQDNEIELTKNGNLLLTAAAVEAAKANILDETTIESNSGVIRLKAGGINKTHFDNTDAKDCVDDDTIEIDATNGLQIKTPATPTGGNINITPGVPVIGWKRYAGSDSAQTVDCGMVIRHFVIRRTDGTEEKAIEGIVDASGLTSWKQGTGTYVTNISLTDSHTLTLPAGQLDCNKADNDYSIFVEGVRL